MAARRIVSLLPAGTELVSALGLGHELVGRSHECDYPEKVVARLPIITRPKVHLNGTSGQTDQSIQYIMAQGLSLFEVDVNALKAAQPDVIITQDDCEACAITPQTLKTVVADNLPTRPQVVSFQATTLPGVLNEFLRIGDFLGAGSKAQDMVNRTRRRMDEVQVKSRDAVRKPKVLALEWLTPLQSAGNWLPTLIEMAGGNPVLAEAGAHARNITWRQIIEADPDVLVIVPCGYSIERTAQELTTLAATPEFRTLRAWKARKVFVADGNHLFNRPGPRLLESLEVMAEMVHPALFGTRRLGHGWAEFF